MNTKIKILHLEDTPSDVELVDRELKRGNIQFEKLVVDNRKAFEAALTAFSPDIIISDHTLPSFNSREALKILKQRGMSVPFILVTSTVSDEYAVEVMKAGADDYILKDRLNRLPQAILNAMEKSKAESNLQSIFDNTSEGFILINKRGIIKTFNINAAQTVDFNTGKKLETGKSLFDFIHPSRKGNYDGVISKVLEGETIRYDYEFKRIDGEIKWFNFIINPVYSKSGKVDAICVTSSDITERKLGEAALRMSESTLHTIFEGTSEGLILTDIEGKIRAFNKRSAQTIFRNTGQHLKIGDSIYDFIHPDRREPYKFMIPNALAGEIIQYDFSVQSKKGDLEWFSFTVNPLFNSSGEVESFCLSFTDITKRKIAEQQLQESEKFTKGVLSSLSAQIAVLDERGNLITVNKSWNDFSINNGLTSLDRVGLGSNYFDVCRRAAEHGDKDAARALAGIKSVFNRDKHFFEMEYPCHSPKEKKWFVLSAMNFGDDINKVVISHQDITQRKITENSLNATSVELTKTLSELNKIMDSSLDIICTISGDGIFVNVSPASMLVLGYTPEELIGTQVMDLIYEEDLEITNQVKEDINNNIPVPFFENRYVHKNGTIVPLLWSINWDANLYVMYCIAKDITEKKKLEKAIINERDQFYNMFFNAPSAVGMLAGPDHVYEMVNPLYLQLSGKKDVIGKTVAEVFPEVIDQGFIDLLNNVYSTGESFTGTEVLVKLDVEGKGQLSELYISFIYHAYRNIEGKVEGIFFFINNVTEQVVSRKNIESSEKKYRQIVETAQEGIWLIDENSKTTFVNKKMCEILQYSEEEMIGKENYYFMDALGKEKYKLALERRKSGKAEKMEVHYNSKNGNRIIAEVSANPIFDDNGIYRGALGMVSDVTETKHLEDLLGKSNRLAKIGSWEVDVEKGTVFWSDITKEIREADFNFIPDLETGIGFFAGPKYKKIITKRVQRCIDKGIPWDEELQLTTFKGNLRWVRTIGEAVMVNGKCSKIFGSLQDITERKNSEKSLLQSQSYLKAIIENTDAAIYSLDTDLRCIAFNKIFHDGMKQIYNVDLKIGDHIFNLLDTFRKEESEDWKEKYLKVLRGETIRFDKEINVGDFFNYSSFTLYPIWEHKTIIGISCFVYDITNKKLEEQQKEKMSAEIIQRNSDLEQFSYMVSHNLRAPAANIIGFTEMLQDKKLTPKERIQSLQGLSASVSGLDTIIKDINTILQDKREDHEKKITVVFSEIVADIVLSIAHLIEKHQVIITTDFKSVNEMYSLKIYIYSIFYNLISNSIKYRKSDSAPHITINSFKKDDKIILTFKDNGLGFNMKGKEERIFGLYNRFHSHVEGKGMGLFMVKTQVEALGGNIFVESNLNTGTVFTIEFKI